MFIYFFFYLVFFLKIDVFIHNLSIHFLIEYAQDTFGYAFCTLCVWEPLGCRACCGAAWKAAHATAATSRQRSGRHGIAGREPQGTAGFRNPTDAEFLLVTIPPLLQFHLLRAFQDSLRLGEAIFDQL